MDINAYERLIKDLCESVGIENWNEILRSQHIMVGDYVVGLINEDNDIYANELSIYVELGPIFPEREPDLYRRMLVANLERNPALTGRFGVHPDTGSAVYYIRLDMSQHMGANALVDLLNTQVNAAVAVFNTLKM